MFASLSKLWNHVLGLQRGLSTRKQRERRFETMESRSMMSAAPWETPAACPLPCNDVPAATAPATLAAQTVDANVTVSSVVAAAGPIAPGLSGKGIAGTEFVVSVESIMQQVHQRNSGSVTFIGVIDAYWRPGDPNVVHQLSLRPGYESFQYQIMDEVGNTSFGTYSVAVDPGNLKDGYPTGTLDPKPQSFWEGSAGGTWRRATNELIEGLTHDYASRYRVVDADDPRIEFINGNVSCSLPMAPVGTTVDFKLMIENTQTEEYFEFNVRLTVADAPKPHWDFGRTTRVYGTPLDDDITVVFNGQYARLYVNGVLENSNDLLPHGEFKRVIIDGGGGNDRIRVVGDVPATIHGGEGDDFLYGGQNDDRIFGDTGNDVLFGRLGNDFLIGGDGDDVLNGNRGNDVIDATDHVFGNDVIFATRDDVVRDDRDPNGGGHFGQFGGTNISGTTDPDSAVDDNSDGDLFEDEPELAVPAAPGEFQVVAKTHTSVTVNWTSDSQIVDRFIVSISDDNGATWHVAGETDASEHALTASGLLAEHSYLFKVVAVNESGTSLETTLEVTTESGRPAQPTDLHVAAVGGNAVTLQWTDNATSEQEYRIAISRNGGQTWDNVAVVGADTTQFQVTGLKEGKSYSFRIRAANEQGFSEFTEAVDIRTLTRPAAPTGLTLTQRTKNSLSINWQAVDNSLGYYIAISKDGVNWTRIAVTPANASGWTITGLAADTNYQIRVRAFNDIGVSEVAETITGLTRKKASSSIA